MSASYKAPLDDIRFAFNVLDVGQLAEFKAFKDVEDLDTLNVPLEMAADMAEKVLQPLNVGGDEIGSKYDPATKTVKTAPGFTDAYEKFRDAGFTTFACSPEYGGAGLPLVLNTAISEIISGSNMAFGLFPGLTHGVYTAMEAVASQEQKDKYLPKFVSGEWSATMCLTEPGAGTDLGQIKTKAIKQPDGSYKLEGSKIFISWGAHDMPVDNTVHLVLARIVDPSTPDGIGGISLFAVPNINDDGSRNAVSPGGIEEKMGIHGSPTCTMNFDGAVGELVGQPNKGMKGMFIMMNEERLGVGAQGLGMSEVAYQNAVAYATERLQSQPIDNLDPKNQTRVNIIEHPLIRSDLLTIRSTIEAGRMLAYWTSLQLDLAHNDTNAEDAKKSKGFVDLLTPIVKAHLTDNAETNTSLALQTFGGNGFIKEYGMEQFSRDARITRIYEGTNGIQALDLLGLKVMQKGLLDGYLAEVQKDLDAAKVGTEFTAPVADAMQALKTATTNLQNKAGTSVETLQAMMRDVGGVSGDYLKLTSLVAMGHMWVKMVDYAQQSLKDVKPGSKEAEFYQTKIDTGRFYMQKIMPDALALAAKIDSGAGSLTATATKHFARPQKTGTIALKPHKKPQGLKAA